MGGKPSKGTKKDRRLKINNTNRGGLRPSRLARGILPRKGKK